MIKYIIFRQSRILHLLPLLLISGMPTKFGRIFYCDPLILMTKQKRKISCFNKYKSFIITYQRMKAYKGKN